MRRILSADVFARVAPEMKLKLATLFQRSGEIVAMTGDGVNDAPALKKADIGIAMGQRGTEVAREAAHMVLRDDAFPTIIAAMREGRIIFDNIRRFVVYLMSCNVSEVLVVGIAVSVGLPAPLLPLQILFLNLVTDIFPAFALGLGEGSDAVMSRPPRPPREPVLDRKRWIFITVFGGLITLATLTAFLVALYGLALDADRAVSVAFTTLALAQLWNVFNARDVDSAILANDVTRNAFVWGAIILCLGVIAAALWLPGLSGLLRLPSPGAEGLILAALFSFTPLLLGQIALLSLRRGDRMAGLQRR
jgi:Ca2+-transporting ATPase